MFNLITLIVFSCIFSLDCSPAHDKFCDIIHPCKNGGICVDSSIYEDYKCLCLKGFRGKHCEIESEGYCEKHSPCLNGGTCVDSGKHSFKCLCEIGYSGDICDVYKTTTVSLLPTTTPLPTTFTIAILTAAINNSSPTDDNSTFADYVEANQPISELFTTKIIDDYCSSHSDVCLNGGTCFSAIDWPYYTCQCVDGISGTNCETQNYEYK